uniref:Uncharacterized protein n=1 Tax=Amphimedon queenslandica TaxID=400682 RepID=A0A1X7SNC3_AMPQE
LSTEKIFLEDSVVPYDSHTMEELETLCPQFKYFHTSAFNLQMFPLPTLPDSCVKNDDVIRPLPLQLQYVIQSFKESLNFFVVNALTTGLELLGKY